MFCRVTLPIPARYDYDVSVDVDPGVPLDQIEDRAYRAAAHHRSRFGLAHIVEAPEVRTGEGRRWADPLASAEVTAAVHRGLARARVEALPASWPLTHPVGS